MGKKADRATDKAKTERQARERRSLALKVFNEIDVAIEGEIAKLAANGQQPTCSKGCAHCCRQAILLPRAEAEAIVEWLKNSAPDLIDNLKVRLQAWLNWYRTEYPVLVAKGTERSSVFYSHGPQCPALVDDACSIYPVRPVVCRTLYMTSSPDACRPDGDPAYLQVPVERVDGIPSKTAPISGRLRTLIESQGADFKGTIHLLPEWLAHLLGVEQQPWRTAPPLDLGYFT